MGLPEHDRGRPGEERPHNVTFDGSLSIPHDPHCCGVLDLELLRVYTQHGIACGANECARWQLALLDLEEAS